MMLLKPRISQVINPDRHTFNFGILRNPDTGCILGLAPNYDNNMALISMGYPKNINSKNDLLIRFFNDLLRYDEQLKNIFLMFQKISEKKLSKMLACELKQNISLSLL